MSGAAEELRGPDGRDGVALSSLPEGEPFAAHADGENLVLVRRGDEVLAIGGTCTHYGGPLAEGLVVGDTIHCPWHHACFSLRTGEAEGAPALSPVARWEVEVRDGRVFATTRHDPEPLDPAGRAPVDSPGTVVVIGAGAAGSAAAERLRQEGHVGRIILVDPEPDAPYDRPNLSKDFLAGDAPSEWIPLRPEGFLGEHGIERVVGAVRTVDAEARTVELADGRRIGYDALLLATGAAPRRLQVDGADLPHVHCLRSLGDCTRIVSAAEGTPQVVVVGGSFIGMEAAAALRSRGLHVTVVAPDSLPFARTLGPQIGRRILDEHLRHGVEFQLERKVAAITSDEVRLDDGTRLPAGLVVVGIGVEPETRLADLAGAAVEDGVLVDEYLETSVSGVFAAGDIARWPAPVPGDRLRVEHWVHAQRMGQAAARNILGRREPFTDVPFFWTAHFDVAVGYSGYGGGWDTIDAEEGADGGLAIRFGRGGETVAIATIGRDLENLRVAEELSAVARRPAGPTTTHAQEGA